jgi:hypothetical protein
MRKVQLSRSDTRSPTVATATLIPITSISSIPTRAELAHVAMHITDDAAEQVEGNWLVTHGQRLGVRARRNNRNPALWSRLPHTSIRTTMACFAWSDG